MIRSLFKNAIALLLTALLFTSCNNTKQSPSGIEHVIVIGVDGMSPNGIRNAKTPVLDSMIANGSIKWKARTVLTTSSSQNWASMIMGAGPEQHGITSNGWELNDHTLPPIVQEKDGRFPTIFSVLRRAHPEAEIGTVYHWGGFGRLFQKDAVNYDKTFSTEDSTAADFIGYIKSKKPLFGFLHLDHVDHAGHHDGHGSPIYYESVTKADSLIGAVLNGIKEAGMAENTLVIITSDHGGIGRGHGGATPEEAEIAMVLFGAGVKKDYKIQQEVYTYDLAATIAFALKTEQPFAWTGRPIKAAFEGFSEPSNLFVGYQEIEAPVIYPERNLNSPAGGLFQGTIPTVKIVSPLKNATVRYTLDGADPDSTSLEYKMPFKLEKTTVVKARAFLDGAVPSSIATGYFRVLPLANGNGVTVTVYESGKLEKVPSLTSLKKLATYSSLEITTDVKKIEGIVGGESKTFAVKLEGFIEIDSPGKYTFYTQSDDGSILYIDGTKVVDNDGSHGVVEKKGNVELTAGKHRIEVRLINNEGGFWLDTYYQGPGVPKQIVPANKLFLK